MKRSACLILAFILLVSSLMMAAYGAPAKKSSKKKVTSPALKDKLAAIASSKCLVQAKAGIKIISLDTGQTVFEKNAYEPLIPASNMKILTTAAALAYLKPEYQFRTVIFTDGKISDGTLRGNLYVKGCGAPDLVAENIWVMMQEFCSQGIKKIDGDIIGDDSYFDSATRPAAWPGSVKDNPYGAPISALSCNFNSVKITIAPGHFGAKPYVFLFPFSDFFTIINNAVTQNSKNHLLMSRVYENGQNRIVVNGSISTNSGGISDYRSVDDPTLYTLSSIRETLRTMGVQVTGTIRKGGVPPKARQVLIFNSRPLAQILYDMNKNSNNFIAEMVLKNLGAEIIGTPGTTEKGCEVAKMFMKDAGINVSNLKILDGSGLSRGNLITADALIRILSHMETKFGESYEFISSLPIGGADGTLERHFRNESVARKVRAKTGYINGVKSLSGYIENRSGEKFAFAMLVNKSRCGAFDAAEYLDDMCEAIALSTSLY